MLFLKTFRDAKFVVDGNAFQTFITLSTKTWHDAWSKKATIYEVISRAQEAASGAEYAVYNCVVATAMRMEAGVRLTVESYTVVTLLTFILIIGIPSPTHSFVIDLKPYFSANPSHRSVLR